MNIAVCVSGAARKIEKSLQSISFIKNTGEVKVFIHTWAPLEGSTMLEDMSFNPVTAGLLKNTPKDVINEFTYEKIQLDCFETRLNYLNNFKNEYNICFTQMPRKMYGYCMFYSMQQTEKLKTEYEVENNMVFDMVYRLRFDSLILNPEQLPTSPYETETLAIPDQNHWGGVNDQFAYGTSLTMSKYLKTYSIIPLLQNKHLYSPEFFLKSCLEFQNIPILKTPLRVSIH